MMYERQPYDDYHNPRVYLWPIGPDHGSEFSGLGTCECCWKTTRALVYYTYTLGPFDDRPYTEESEWRCWDCANPPF